MKHSPGLTNKGSSPDGPATEQPPPTHTQFFFQEWITSVLYAGQWHMVKEGTFKEGICTDRGEMAVYEDPFDGEILFVMEPITGYRVKKPIPPPPPPPQASVTPLHKK